MDPIPVATASGACCSRLVGDGFSTHRKELEMPYHWWLIGALVLAIGEMFTIGFVLGCLAVGAVVAGLTALATDSHVAQLAAFTVGSIAAGVLLRPLALRYLHKPGTTLETNVAALINQVAIVVEPPDPVSGIGRVLVAGENWRAKIRRGVEIGPLSEKGSRASVIAIEGATVVIEPANPASIPPHADSQLSY
jgi:membrane protein implicated in regulation of membrane protease activity